MKFAIIGGNTRWSKILIKNFKNYNHRLLFSSSKYIDKKNNYKDFKKIPIRNLDFLILASSTSRNLDAFKYFIKKKIPLFVEKPIANNYKNYLVIKKVIKSNLAFVHYQHIYSDPIIYLKKQFAKEKLISIKIDFGKNGPYKDINSSYEWLPHPLSILFYLFNYELKLPTKYSNYINKKKTNIIINGNISKEIYLTIKSGNNFKKKKYFIKIMTDKKIYTYNATNPKELIVDHYIFNKKKVIKFKSFPLDSSIKVFSSILKDKKKKRLVIRQNKNITNKIMKYLYKTNL